MPRLTNSNPKYRHHKPTASRKEYDRLIAEWLANGRRLGDGPSDVAVVELVAAYWKFAKDYYRGSDPSRGVLASLRLALGHLKRLYGRTAAVQFGPLVLKAVRESMVSAGWSRNYVNAQVGRIRRVGDSGEQHRRRGVFLHQRGCDHRRWRKFQFGRNAGRQPDYSVGGRHHSGEVTAVL